MLTKRQGEILDIIAEYIEVEEISPTIREVAALAGISSSSTAFYILRRLEKAGDITVRRDIPRGIRLTREQSAGVLFGDRIRRLRENADMTQAEVGKILGISDRVLSYYESNERFPRKAEILIKLTEIFDVTMDYLISGCEKNPNKPLPQYGDVTNLSALEAISILENLFKGKVISDGEKAEICSIINNLYFQEMKGSV